MANCTNLLSVCLSKKLGFFLKFMKNSITVVLSDIFVFKTNNAINKNAIWLFLILLI